MLIESLVDNNTLIMVDDRPPTSDSAQLPLGDTAAQLNPWDDVFESDSSHHPAITTLPTLPIPSTENATAAATLHATSSSHDFLPRAENTYASDIVSDFERLRSTHATVGYRDGISVGKAASIQTGFDEGFALGGEIGRAVGYILGCVQGIATALPGDEEITHILKEVGDELRLESVFARDYLSEDGLWKYDVAGEENGEVTFEQVAWAHPLVKRCRQKLQSLAEKRVVDLEALKRRMGDAEDGEDGEEPASDL